jgi:hypothetical protein
MKPKVLELVQSLSPSEADSFLDQLANGKTGENHLQTLFYNLYQIREDWNNDRKKDLFTSIYLEPYHKKKDYLLRNLFRNLSEKLEDFLELQEMKRELAINLNLQNYYLLKSLEQRKLYRLFNQLYKGAIDQAEETLDFHLAGAICNLAYNHFMLHYAPTDKVLKVARELNQRQLSLISFLYLNKFLNAQIQRQIYDFDKPANWSVSDAMVDQIPKESLPFSDYFELKIRLFHTENGGQKIPMLLHALSLLEEEPVSMNLREEQLFCKTVLAIEYGAAGAFQKADKLFLDLLSDLKRGDNPLIRPIICDYLINLIMLEKWPELLSAIDRYRSVFKGYEHYKMRLEVIEMIGFAFRRDGTIMEQRLPQNLSGLPEYLKYFYRFLYSIQFYLQGDFENALREISNFQQLLRKQKKADLHEKTVADFYKRFYYLLNQNAGDPEKGAHFFERLHHEIKVFSESSTATVRDYLPFFWLKKEIDRLAF